jgi:hypothetical protein
VSDGFAISPAVMRDIAATLRSGVQGLETLGPAPSEVDAGDGTAMILAAIAALTQGAGELSVRVSAASAAVDAADVCHVPCRLRR